MHKMLIPKKPVCITEKELAGYVFEEGEDTREAGERLAASYVNFYIGNKVCLLYTSIRNWREVRCEIMSSVIVKENETLDSALRRFKRNCAKAGIQQEIRKREHYEKPSVRRKKKSEAARKRKYN